MIWDLGLRKTIGVDLGLGKEGLRVGAGTARENHNLGIWDLGIGKFISLGFRFREEGLRVGADTTRVLFHHGMVRILGVPLVTVWLLEGGI